MSEYLFILTFLSTVNRQSRYRRRASALMFQAASAGREPLIVGLDKNINAPIHRQLTRSLHEYGSLKAGDFALTVFLRLAEVPFIGAAALIAKQHLFCTD